ncbi:MAG: nucleotidyltransferase family protein, partial [Desulfovibrionales bacterium]
MTILQEIDAIPELRFVVLCSCLDPDSETQALIQKMGVTSLDWDKVYETAREQRTLPLVSRNIRSIIPAKTALPIAQKLKSFSFQNTTRNLFALNLLLNIVRIFRENNISVMPFKGLLTAEDIYGDIGLRSFSDLDLLVKKNQALKASNLLKNHGFLPEIALDQRQAEKYIQVE